MADSTVALVTDLIFGTKIASTARSLGIDLRIVRTLDAFSAGLADAPRLAIIDMNVGGADPLAAIQAARQSSSPPRIVAFLSHVQTQLADGARAAGADAVLPRSAFSAQLPQILSGEIP